MNLPSHHQIDQPVTVTIGGIRMGGVVNAVKFSRSKVYYDIIIGEEILKDIDSICVSTTTLHIEQ